MKSYFIFGMHYDIAEYFNFSAQRVKSTGLSLRFEKRKLRLAIWALTNDNCAVENKLVD